MQQPFADTAFPRGPARRAGNVPLPPASRTRGARSTGQISAAVETRSRGGVVAATAEVPRASLRIATGQPLLFSWTPAVVATRLSSSSATARSQRARSPTTACSSALGTGSRATLALPLQIRCSGTPMPSGTARHILAGHGRHRQGRRYMRREGQQRTRSHVVCPPALSSRREASRARGRARVWASTCVPVGAAWPRTCRGPGRALCRRDGRASVRRCGIDAGRHLAPWGDDPSGRGGAALEPSSQTNASMTT